MTTPRLQRRMTKASNGSAFPFDSLPARTIFRRRMRRRSALVSRHDTIC